MSPAQIQQFTRMFLPMIQSSQSMQNQTALGQLQRIQAHKGIANSPIARSQTLGFLGAQGNNALQQAFNQAFQMAGNRAGIWQGAQPPQVQPNLHMAQGIQQGISQGLLAYALSGKNKEQAVPSPFSTGASWGLPPTYNHGVLG